MKNSELKDLGRKIANATSGTGVDFADLADIMATTLGQNGNAAVPNQVLERLRVWFDREQPKLPVEIVALQVMIGAPKNPTSPQPPNPNVETA